MSERDNSVQCVGDSGMCCGCGICAAVCPVGAITHGLYEDGRCGPHISDACVNCGVCRKSCPQQESASGAEFGRDVQKTSGETIGDATCVLVKSRDEKILQNATSGGFVTTLVQALLERGEYTAAFCVDTDNYSGVVNTRRLQREEDFLSTQKSRYVQVAHTEEIAYILSHREEKLILIGTPCYLQGFQKVLKEYGLERDRYLLIGLFCDRTMTAHVWEYFNTIFAGEKLQGIHFRSKGEKGWPGDVKLFTAAGERMLSRRERMDVKDYFMPEACLYCEDKLNETADFSVGDDYVTGGNGGEGANTVILRTGRAKRIWDSVEELFESRECTMEQIEQSQHLKKRRRNELFRALKGQTAEAAREKTADAEKEQTMAAARAEYERLLGKINAGAGRQYEEIHQEILRQRKRKAGYVYRFLRHCKRILKKTK